MTKTLGTWLVTATLLTAATAAEAARVHKNVMAAAIHRTAVTIPAHTTTIFETTNLSAGADTVMHLWNGVTELAFDDDGGGGLASKIVFQNPGATSMTVTLFVRAFSGNTPGTATLLRDGAVLAPSIPVAGTRLAVPCGAGEVYETALAPNGTRDTMLMGLSSTSRLRALDDDGGVGFASRIGGRADVCQVIVIPFNASDPGLASVYANDSGNDADGDGLGAALETALQTCDNATASGCTTVFNPADTDRDGLSDLAEVFGVDDSAFPQHLPRWGADPRHKDVFVEVDFTSDFAAQPFTGADARTAQSYFDVGSAASLQNPDGLGGVRLHLDIGRAPTDAADATLYGDWGCTSSSGCGSSQVPATLNYIPAADSQRAALRAGIFHYALISLAEGGGQSAAVPADRFGWGGTTANRYVGAFVHELGHNVGLAHHGHDTWGVANCKPNYRSIMNYAFGGLGFSTSGALPALDPAAVSEEFGLGPWQSPTFLEGDPFAFTVTGEQVDWNRDGLPSPTYPPVRAGVTWATWHSCNAFDQNAIELTSAPPRATTPVIVRRLDRLYVFWVSPDHHIKYRQGLTSGPDWNGSCPGDDRLGATCMTFGPEQQVPTTDLVDSVSSVVWNDTTIVVAYQAMNTNRIRVLRSLTMNTNGDVSTWSTDAFVSASFTHAEPHLVVMEVDPTHFLGNPRIIGIAYSDHATAQYRLAWAPGPGSPWTVTTMKDGTGANIVGPLGPTIAAVPNSGDDHYCAALSNAQSAVRMYCYARPTNRWEDVTQQAYGSIPVPISTGKPGLAYHIHRFWNGPAVNNDTSRGQFHLTVVTPAGFPDVFVSATLRASEPPLANLDFKWVGKFGNQWTGVMDGTGLALFEDAGLSALKGVWVQKVDGTMKVRFLPLADGTFDAVLEDGDDFQVMERALCGGIVPSAQRDAVCGSAATTQSNL